MVGSMAPHSQRILLLGGEEKKEGGRSLDSFISTREPRVLIGEAGPWGLSRVTVGVDTGRYQAGVPGRRETSGKQRTIRGDLGKWSSRGDR